MDERSKKLEELFQDADLANAVFNGNVDEVLTNLAAQGIEMSKQELMDFSAGIVNGNVKYEEGELSEDDLSMVAGGRKKKKINFGFFNGLFDSADDRIFGTHKGANKSGLFYALGYTIGYGLGYFM